MLLVAIQDWTYQKLWPLKGFFLLQIIGFLTFLSLLLGFNSVFVYDFDTSATLPFNHLPGVFFFACGLPFGSRLLGKLAASSGKGREEKAWVIYGDLIDRCIKAHKCSYENFKEDSCNMPLKMSQNPQNANMKGLPNHKQGVEALGVFQGCVGVFLRTW